MNMTLWGKALPAVTLVAMVSGCATSGGDAPEYDAKGSAASQADTFIESENEKYMANVDKVGVLSCNVMFGVKSAASASTSGGFRSDATRATGTTRRSDVKVTVTYTAEGVTESQMQSLANRACDNAEKALASAGFQVTPHAVIKANPHYQAMHAGGRESPFEYKGSGDTRYLVMARDGETISDPRYIGAAGGFAQAFKSVGGDASLQHESLLIKDLGVTGVNINILIDFAQLQSDGHGSFGGFASKNSAKVDGKVQLAATGDLRFLPIDKQKCWSQFGKEQCMIKTNHQPVFSTRQAVASSGTFYSSIEDVTTTTDKATSGITKAIGMLSAFGGTSSSVARDITRYQVNLIPASYDQETRKLSSGVVAMAAEKAAASR
ncbi:hypothetical protein A11A3_08090 [Alcanivorax hongdengensis A-11-3]|uniref:Lipoprotein n=1 Tax=Alcanivorax hongdengensis A-11-3 TaxID=1177179 RepID=L0WC93_9GAMM|nr:hypothetical protein [Alcanivorax hongdengensis]EKF74571.1 hypothetical protein A11A3_08090 [Alcanivorax hongdengensis A-11-3]